jgi:hypothetical protein
MITLTVPNTETIRKHDFTLFRQRVRALIAQHKGWIGGGVYSLETTYNRQQKTWHLHCHILADLAAPLPPKSDKVEIRGKKKCRFTAMKRRLEYDWLRLWRSDMGKKPRENASADTVLSETYKFEEWLEISERMRIKDFRGRPLEGLTEQERTARTEWNRKYRRVVHIAPVDDREKAALEVLKYITKVSAFCDVEEAIEPFMSAVRSARLIQTFGSWYGVKLDDEKPDPETPQSAQMVCTCGCNDWKRMGLFHAQDVRWDESLGAYVLKRPFDHNSPGHAPSARTRCLARRQE